MTKILPRSQNHPSGAYLTVVISLRHFFNKIEKSDKKGISKKAKLDTNGTKKSIQNLAKILPIPNGLFVKDGFCE